MSDSIRDFGIVSQSVTAGIESEITIPYDINYLELIIITTTGADARLAWESGQTINDGRYIPINPDYWTPDGTTLPAGKKFYIRSAINNTFKIKYGKR